MDRVLDRQELEAQLRQKREDIDKRLGALETEFSTVGLSVKKAVRKKPIETVGGAVAAGVLAGLMFGGRKQREGQPADRTHRALVEQYMAAVADETQRAVQRGKDAGEAVREAFQDRVPLIVYTDGRRRHRTFLGQVVDIFFSTAIGFGIKVAADYLATRLAVQDAAEKEAETGEPNVPDALA